MANMLRHLEQLERLGTWVGRLAERQAGEWCVSFWWYPGDLRWHLEQLERCGTWVRWLAQRRHNAPQDGIHRAAARCSNPGRACRLRRYHTGTTQCF